MEDIERNDVDISKIFDWGRVYEVIDPVTEEVQALVYMKLLGDADLGRARVHALRKSSELRRKLKEQDSDERLAYIRDIDELQIDDLINLILVFSSREISQAARRDVVIPEPKPPKSNAPLQKSEKFQKEVDEYPKKRAKAIADEISKKVEALRNSLKELSKEELYKKYTTLLIDEFCEREALESFKNMQVYLGCFKEGDYKKRFFESFEEFDNLEPTAKARFKDAYDSIDIDTNELKKLRRATQ